MADEPMPTPRQALAWLEETCRRLLQQARHPWPSGLVCYYPAANGEAYPAFYLRDFTYMVESAPQFIPAEDVRFAIDAFLGGIYRDESAPQLIARDGQCQYFCHGARMPALDNAMFLVNLVDAYARHYLDDRHLHSHFESLQRVLAAVPTDRQTQLAWVDPRRPYTSYGFQDTVEKSGCDLFCSLLLHQAHAKLATHAARLGRHEQAGVHREKMQGIVAGLEALYSAADGLYLAASESCRQVDIWGSIFGCAMGVFPPQRRQEVARQLWEQRDRYLHRAQVRHLRQDEYWESLFTANLNYRVFLRPGQFQNGAYWATPTGWLAEVFESVRPGTGVALLCELVADMRAHGVWECVGPEGYCRVAGNLSSVALPLASLRRISNGRHE
jgi:hypothetical protein